MPLNPRRAEPFIWDGDWSKLPGVLTSRHMAAIKGVSVDRIWDLCAARSMRPKPDTWLRNYRWQKARVMAEMQALQEAS